MILQRSDFDQVLFKEEHSSEAHNDPLFDVLFWPAQLENFIALDNPENEHPFDERLTVTNTHSLGLVSQANFDKSLHPTENVPNFVLQPDPRHFKRMEMSAHLCVAKHLQ